MSSQFVSIGDVVERRTGSTNPAASPDAEFIYVDVAAVDNERKVVAEPKRLIGANAPSRARKLIRSGDILVSSVRPNLNAVAIVPESLDGQVASTGFAILRPSSRVLTEYLFYFVRSSRFVAELTKLTAGAMYPAVSDQDILNQQLPLPSIDEQRRIVDLLSRAEGIVRLRHEAQKKAQEIIPALFLDMFGDPATNPKGWPIEKFGVVGTLDRGKSRHRPRDAQELYGGPYPFIQTGDVANSSGRIRSYTATYSELGLAQSRRWPKGTLCITIAANIANTGVLEFDACFPDSVVGFLPGQRVRTEYVQAWLGFLRPMLEATAPQAAQKNINLEILRSLPIPVPPGQLQVEFEKRCGEIVAIQAQQTAATEKSDATFEALLSSVFS